jgi:hypothetical protein
MAGKFKYDAHEQNNENARDDKNLHGMCEVFGCPRWGHIYRTNWNCRYHDGQLGDKLAHITLMLKNHSRKVDWYEHILQTTIVEFELNLYGSAPQGLEAGYLEGFFHYKQRLQRTIESLLGMEGRNEIHVAGIKNIAKLNEMLGKKLTETAD